MDDVPQRLAQWWGGLDDRARRHASVLALISAGFIGHYLVFTIPQPFFIEDAGISFAFARNLVEGDGLVGYPGGERVEGYSNFSWTMLVAAFYALGVPPWTSAKVMGAVFGVLTLPLVYRIVRKARPDGQGGAGLLAAGMLAASPQFVIWAASGLENSLFCLLLAAGIDAVLREMDGDVDHRIPRSALFFAALAMTRPEGLAYGAIAGFALLLDAVAKRSVRRLPVWVLTLALPLVAYHGWRYWYFAWEFPNTYYAKLGKGTAFKPWSWTTGGWKYIKKYLTNHGVVYVLPIFAVATAGLRTRMRWVGLTVTALLGVLVFWDGKAGLDAIGIDPLPDGWRAVTAKWSRLRVWSILGGVAILGLATLTRPGWRSRGVLWSTTCFATFFALYAGGDWMAQHRWFNMVVMGMVPLMALGVAELLDALGIQQQSVRPPASWGFVPRGLRGGVKARMAAMLTVLGVWLGVEGYQSNRFANGPETSVRDIMRRVRYMSWVQRRLDVDDVVLLDVDMGAHMYYSGWEIVDIAGLIDVPMARHSNFDRKFIRNYIFEERNPDFAHVHGGWARTSKIDKHREWRDRYIEVPGYPIGRGKLHIGNHIRRDLFIAKSTEPIPIEAPRFEGLIRLTHFDVPAPEVAAGTRLFLDTEWAASLRDHDFRILVFLHNDERTAVGAFAPGYTWVPSDEWKTSDRVAGRYRYKLPKDLPEGEYKVGVVLLDEDTGEVLPWRNQGEPVTTPPVYMGGEWLSEETVRVVSVEDAMAAAEADVEAALGHARGGACADVWPAWKNAQRHVDDQSEWIREHDAEVRRARAGCLLAKVRNLDDLDARVLLLTEARRIDRKHPHLDEWAQPAADEAEAKGDDHFAQEEWEKAYRAYTQALAVDPSRSWTRRRAEDARDYWLRIVRPGRTKADLPERRLTTQKKDKADDQKEKTE